MKTYVLTVSQFFPKTHPRSGESTGFVEAIKNLFSDEQTKIHTIRANYDFWKKRVDEINDGNAILSIRFWTGKPYNSKQEELVRLEKVGIQKIRFPFPNMHCFMIDEIQHQDMTLSKNDGLSYRDFADWFGKYNLYEPMAIIHFTNFKY